MTKCKSHFLAGNFFFFCAIFFFKMFAEKKHAKKKGRTIEHQERIKKIESTMETPEFKTYIDNLQKFKYADAVLLVLDARNPFSCRYAPYEELLGPRLWFVLNKIDLAPRESVIQWYKVFTKLGNTFAVKATENVDPLITFIKKQIESVDKFKIVITGIPNSGKKTVASRLRGFPKVSVEITKPWIWIKPTPDLYVLGSIEFSSIADNRIMHARDFISRCDFHSIMEVLGVVFFNDPDVVLATIDSKKSIAAMEFFKRIQQGSYLFYTAPPPIPNEQSIHIPQIQIEQFKLSKTIDQYEKFFICIGSALQSVIMEELLPSLHYLAAKNEAAMKSNPEEEEEEDIP